MSNDTKAIVDLFSTFQENFDEDQEVREKIRNCVKELEIYNRELMTLLQQIHMNEPFDKILPKADLILEKTKAQYEPLKDCILGGEYYRYHDHWRNTTQRFVFLIALIKFIESGDLATREDVAEKLSLKVRRMDGFHIDLEDYLHGILILASELSRYAVTSATTGNYSRPVQISNFVSELNAGFRLINFKNDSLRKHYDGLKYDLKKIEEVVYDISIRGLKPSN